MKKAFLLSLALFLSASLSAQSLRMADVFSSMPDSVLPLLSSVNRRDMLDFYNNGMEARVHNQLGEESTLKSLTDTYLLLQSSPASHVEIKLLETADTAENVIALVRTVETPSPDSDVELYDTQWHRLQGPEFPRPVIADFWTSAPDSLTSSARYAQLSLADLPLVSVAVSPDEPLFTLTLATEELAEKEKDAAKLLVHPLQYLWDGAAFRRKE
ncbi:MAG: DUF3256 family protein [Prevotellaceae bacterium]|nr:DUF3256 family protein [Prevotellaceae bacterium]